MVQVNGGTTGMAPWWEGLNPDSNRLFAYGSDVEWVRGTYAATLGRPAEFARLHPWMPPSKGTAWAMTGRDRDMCVNLLAALLSWRTCTVGQLRAGLCQPTPYGFDRTEPNLYGALNRLGVINVGFSPAERLEGVRVPHVWLSVGNDATLVRAWLKRFAAGTWVPATLTRGSMSAQHTHARHNMFATHVGLTAAHHPQVMLTGGDGWGGFRDIDPAAARQADVRVASTDVVMLTKGRVLAGVETQTSAHSVWDKTSRWVRMLAASPMPRRGLVCVWLLIPAATTGRYADLTPILEQAAALPEARAGDPPVTARMGVARWDEWYGPDGQPGDGFGTYHDLTGVGRSLFDPAWETVTPANVNPSRTAEWGWAHVRESILSAFGWDTTGWTLPTPLRGGFGGFTKGGAAWPVTG